MWAFLMGTGTAGPSQALPSHTGDFMKKTSTHIHSIDAGEQLHGWVDAQGQDDTLPSQRAASGQPCYLTGGPAASHSTSVQGMGTRGGVSRLPMPCPTAFAHGARQDAVLTKGQCAQHPSSAVLSLLQQAEQSQEHQLWSRRREGK